MRSLSGVLIALLILNSGYLPFVPLAEAAPDYTIDGDVVYIDDAKATIKVYPHTTSGGWVYVNVTSKTYEGDIDILFGYDSNKSKPRTASYYKPRNQTITYNYTIQNGDIYNYTLNPNYIWVYHKDNASAPWLLTFEGGFDSWDIPTKTIFWDVNYSKTWKSIAKRFDYESKNYQGFNDWYLARNLPVTIGKEEHLRIWIDVNPTIKNIDIFKYYFGFKPSGETFQQAIDNDHFYFIDPWYDSNWGYRKSHNISAASAGALTNYQIMIRPHYGAGTDSGADVYLNSNSNTDFSDIRFTNSSGDDLLDHWIETIYYSDNATVWVEVDTIAASGNTTIYIYYGNAGASDASDGEATFILFDHFLGVALNASLWTATNDAGCGGGIAGSIITIISPAVGNKRCGIHSIPSHSDNTSVRANVTFPNHVLYQYFSVGHADAAHWPDGSGTDYVVIIDVLTGGFYMYLRTESGGVGTGTNITYSTGNYHIFESRWNTSRVFAYEDGVQLGNHTTNIPTISILTFFGTRTNTAFGPASTITMSADFILLRQWVNPEPENGDWGDEESEFELTIYFHTGIATVLLNGSSVANGSTTDYAQGDVANITITASSGFAYFRIYFNSFLNHSHQNPRMQVINQGVTANIYALSVGGGGVAGASMLLIAVVGGFAIIVAIAVLSGRRK
jgi:hypothetical protein